MLSTNRKLTQYGKVVEITQTELPCNSKFLSNVKNQLKYKSLNTMQESTLKDYIDVAVDYIEKVTRRSVLSQKWRIVLESFPEEDYISLSNGPVISVDTFTTINSSNVSDTTFADYAVDGDRLFLNDGFSWPTDLRARSSIKIDYTTGYASVSKVPPTIIQAIVLLVAHWDTNREPVGCVSKEETKYMVDSLIGVSRKFRI